VNSPRNPNAARLLSAVEKLVPLLDQIVFVGGCAAGLLISDPAAAPVRPTIDVDAIVEITSYVELMALENRLRELGFEQPPVEGTPLCRWIHGDLILDLMPTDSSILGFGNRWYAQAVASASTVVVGEHQIRLISAPCFLATKLGNRRGNARIRGFTSAVPVRRIFRAIARARFYGRPAGAHAAGCAQSATDKDCCKPYTTDCQEAVILCP
jgi:hypothetical protein